MSNFTEEELEEKLRKAHEDNGECGSCGWHSSFYEMNYEPTGELVNGKQEWWDICRSKDDNDSIDHRGCFIYKENCNE